VQRTRLKKQNSHEAPKTRDAAAKAQKERSAML
jgi:hypothetical protein